MQQGYVHLLSQCWQWASFAWWHSSRPQPLGPALNSCWSLDSPCAIGHASRQHAILRQARILQTPGEPTTTRHGMQWLLGCL
jgi:hypothetical protein